MPRIRAASIDEHKALTRSALLKAARTLIAEAGTAEIPLGEVALAAGVGRTTLYDYFTDRDDMIACLVEDELPLVLADLIASVPDGLTVADRLASLASAMVEFVATDPVFGVILHREAGRMGLDAQERIRDSHAQLASELAGVYMRGVADGLFSKMPPALAGRLIQDTIMSGAKVLIADEAMEVAVVTRATNIFLLRGLGYEGFLTDG